MLTEETKSKARDLAQLAVREDARGDVVARDKAILDLFVVVGYWKVSRNPSVAEFRGEAVPPKMLRMPAGRAVPWPRRWTAIEAWASAQ